MLKPSRPKKPTDELGDEVEKPPKIAELKRLERHMEQRQGITDAGDPGELGVKNPLFLPGGKRKSKDVKFRRGGAVRDYAK